MFKIGEFSKLSNVTIRMLRHYDKLGLLTPQSVDKDSGYRYYTASQLKIINKIQRLKELGFNLTVIKQMINLKANIPELKKYLTLREAELQEELAKLQTQSLLLESTVNLLNEDISKMDYHVSLKSTPARNVISHRRVIGAYNLEGELWKKLCSEIEKQEVKIATEPYAMAIFHDEEHKDSDVDVEIQMAVCGHYQDTDEIIFKTVDAIQVASATLAGSYEQMGKVVATIAQWVEDNGYQLNGPMFNIYQVSPAQDPNPENWITEACFPVTKIEE